MVALEDVFLITAFGVDGLQLGRVTFGLCYSARDIGDGDEVLILGGS